MDKVASLRVNSVPGWVSRRRPRGDAPVTCMVLIIAAIAAGIFCYYHFYYDRALQRAGQDIVVLAKSDDGAVNTYRLRTRDKIAPAVNTAYSDTRKLLNPVFENKVSSFSDIEADWTHMNNVVHDLIVEVNSQGVPSKHKEVHRKFARSVGENWNALMLVKQGFKEEDMKLRKAAFEKAKNEIMKSKRDYTQAKFSLDQMFK